MVRPTASSPKSPRELLREAGLRSTAPRTAVLEHLQSNRGPVSHGELVEALADLGFDAATIYRNLIDLEGVALVSRVNLGDNVWRFELRGREPDDRRNHPHFVCLECGEVTCLAQVRVKLTPGPGSDKSVIGNIADVVIKGQCVRCS